TFVRESRSRTGHEAWVHGRACRSIHEFITAPPAKFEMSRNTAGLGPMQEQYISSRLPTPVRASNHQPENFLVTHADIKRFIKRYSSLLKWSTAIGILLGAAYAGTAVPLYTAHAQIIIDPSLPKSLTDTRDNIFGIDNAQVES